MHLTQCHHSVKSRLVVGDDEIQKWGALRPFRSCCTAFHPAGDLMCGDVFVEHDEVFWPISTSVFDKSML